MNLGTQICLATKAVDRSATRFVCTSRKYVGHILAKKKTWLKIRSDGRFACMAWRFIDKVNNPQKIGATRFLVVTPTWPAPLRLVLVTMFPGKQVYDTCPLLLTSLGLQQS